MSLSPQFLDELRARTTLSALVGKSAKLTKAGREYKACCPFHNEKTPSFYVNDEKGFYHCFGCQAHGDAIRWLTDARGLPFMDAVKELADAAGMELPAPDPQAKARAERALGLYEAMEAAQAFFEEQLGGLEGSEARAYLQKRGIGEATRKRFGFGFAPDSRGKLKTALKAFGNEKLIEGGLLIQPDPSTGSGAREPYDRFRGRLTFPIRDRRGRVIAFSARILGPGEPKYLNSPETPIFDKGRNLFNLDRAAPAARTAGRVIVVEGQMDAIALDQAGIGEAVAPLGTALTEMQLALLWQMSPTPILCFDGDSAGQKAAVRGALRALPHLAPGRSLSFATLPPGQDPDDLMQAGGPVALEALLAQPEALVDRLWRHEREAEPLDTPEQRAGLKRRLLALASEIGDPDVREQYRAELLRRFDETTRPPRREWQPYAPRRGNARGGFQPPPRPASDAARAVGTAGLSPAIARAVLEGLTRYPALIADHAEAIAALPLAAAADRKYRDLLLDAAFAHDSLDPGTLRTILADAGAPVSVEGAGQQRGLNFSFVRTNADPERAQRELVLVVDVLAARPELVAAYEAATVRLKETGDETNFAEQQRLRAEIEEADRRLARLVLNDETI